MSTNHLYKRNNTYYFRLRIPHDLKHVIPITEIKKSLKCNTIHSAKSLGRVLASKAEEVFILLRSQVLSPEQQIDVAGRLAEIGVNSSSWVNRAGKAVTVDNAAVKVVASKQQVRKLSNVIGEYIQDKKCRWSSKTLVEYESIFQVILKAADDKDIRDYSRSDLIAFRDTILKLPPNFTKKAEYKNKTIQQVLAMPYTECISDKTANGYIINLAAVFKWSLQQGYIEANYAEGLSMPENKSRVDQEREAYSIEDLKRLCRTEGFRGETRHQEPEKYWIPLIALYGGLRLNEICQLHTKDILEIDGVPCFDVNTKEDKQLKTSSSVRIVPIHPTLISLGLMSYVQKLRDRNAPRLWMNLKKYREGYSKYFGKWYSQVNREYITESRTKCFHSFRHTFINELKQRGVQDTLISELVGHSTSGSMTMGRYGKRYQPKVLLEALVQLDYGVDIPKWKV
ncbi:MAG TPA: site-specific integrase [Dongiaceae bacterium]|nr:site-specific integrase [Dongiaceae bacterium]